MADVMYEFYPTGLNEFEGMPLSLDCGQAFRPVRLDEHTWYTVVKDTICVVYLSYSEVTQYYGPTLKVFCDEYSVMKEENWKEYFDLGSCEWECLNRFVRLCPQFEGKQFCLRALEHSRYLRLLSQDPWETMISFILSQRSSIPSIRTRISRLCKSYGRELQLAKLKEYSFPTPEMLRDVSIVDYEQLGFGYRAEYVKCAVDYVLAHPDWVKDFSKLDDESLLRALQSLKGIGLKVASCIALFSFRRREIFPVDIWIERAINKYFGGVNPAERFGEYAGLMQQCIYNYMLATNNTIE